MDPFHCKLHADRLRFAFRPSPGIFRGAIAEAEIALLQKGSIMLVKMATNEIRTDLPYQNRVFAKVFLLSGDILKGFVFIDLPKTYPRLSDFLNFSKRFFFIEVNEQDYVINTKFVKMVNPGS